MATSLDEMKIAFDFYRDLYFMKPNVFMEHLTNCLGSSLQEQDIEINPLTFYIHHLARRHQIKLYSHLLPTYDHIRCFNNVGFFICKMQFHFYNKRCKIPNEIIRAMPKVLLNIIDEYVSLHFVEVFKILSVQEKEDLIKWHNTNLFR